MQLDGGGFSPILVLDVAKNEVGHRCLLRLPAGPHFLSPFFFGSLTETVSSDWIKNVFPRYTASEQRRIGTLNSWKKDLQV